MVYSSKDLYECISLLLFYRIGTGERKNLAMGNPEVPGPGAYHNPHGNRS